MIDWDRQETAARTERLEEEERLAAMVSRDRDISEIVRSTLTENVRGGSEASTWAVGGGFGLGFIASPVAGLLGVAGGGGGASSSAWQNSSRGLAANSLQQLRDRTMQSASAVRSQRSAVVQTVRQGEAMRVQTEVVANHNHCHSMTMEYFEVLRHLQVKQELTDVQECLFVPLLMSKFDPTKALRWREPLGAFLRNRALGGGFAAIERMQNNYEGSDLPTGRYSQETVEYLDGELRISFQLSRPNDKADGAFEEANWQLYAPFLWTSPPAVYNQYLSGRVEAERDRIFQASVAPRIAETFVQNLKFHLVGSTGEAEVKLDPTLVSSYAPNTPLYVSLRPADAVPAVTREWVTRLRISTNTPLPQYSKAVLHSGSMRYRTKHMSHFLFRDWGISNDLVPGDPVTIPTYLDRRELRNPREEDKELAKRLLAHLNEHIEHYHKAVWWGMDSERRYMLLDGFVAPNANGRSVASVVENRLIGIVGNCLVMPVARGFHLDPTYRQDAENPVDLLHHYVPTTPAPPMRLSVPTRGVFGEAVMGSCNSCEVKDDTRFWRFEESPCGDEPAPISGVSAESRRSTPPDLEAKDFPTPMINLQNAPAAPDPTGLAAAMQLLGNPNLFRDITGLTENQKNALAALQASFDAAKFFGGEASKLVQQQALTKDIDKTLQTIQKAEKAGLINEEQASTLTNSALQGMVGADRKPDKSLTDKPEVKNLIKSAAASDESDVSLSDSRLGESIAVKASHNPPAPASRIRFVLGGNVGQGGANASSDVYALKDRLRQLGFDWLSLNDTVDADTIAAIRLFQAIKSGHHTIAGHAANDGLVEVGGDTYRWLQAYNAPRWQLMPTGSRTEGFHNSERFDAGDNHDYGTDWMARTIEGAGSAYLGDYLSTHPAAALLTVNDVSLPRGGDTPDHAGHETGLACDLRLPRNDGTAPGNTRHNTPTYDQNAMRAMLQAIQGQDLVTTVYFNDPVLVGEGLCATAAGHDDHAHFEIEPPERGAIELIHSGDTHTA